MVTFPLSVVQICPNTDTLHTLLSVRSESDDHKTYKINPSDSDVYISLYRCDHPYANPDFSDRFTALKSLPYSSLTVTALKFSSQS